MISKKSVIKLEFTGRVIPWAEFREFFYDACDHEVDVIVLVGDEDRFLMVEVEE